MVIIFSKTLSKFFVNQNLFNQRYASQSIIPTISIQRVQTIIINKEPNISSKVTGPKNMINIFLSIKTEGQSPFIDIPIFSVYLW